MSNTIPAPDHDAPKRRRLLNMVADVLGTQAEMARMLRMESSTISQWLSGKRGPPDWHVVHEAIKRLLRRNPEAAPAFVEVMAADLFETEGTWKPRPEGDVGDFSDESADVVVAHGELTQAVRSGDPKRVLEAKRKLEREAEEVGLAALRVIDDEDEPLRVAR